MKGLFSQQLENIGTDAKPIINATTVDLSKLAIRAGELKDKMLTTFKQGKSRGLTTHIDPVDKIFTWKPGFLYGFTGYPQSGKSEWINFLALLKAKFAGWKWLVYSPESGDADEYFDQLIHTLVGQSVDPKHSNQMNEAQYLKAIDFVHDHFFLIEDEKLDEQGLLPTPEALRDIATALHQIIPLQGFIKDPWNTLTHKADRDDIYLSNQLAAEKRLAKRLKLVNVILVHPKSPNLAGYDASKGFPVPKAHDIANGAMWNNKMDVIGAVHRTNYHIDKTDPFAVFVTHKVKKQNLVGLPGEVDIKFDRRENRYTVNGACPLVTPGVQPEYKEPTLPASEFENEKIPF